VGHLGTSSQQTLQHESSKIVAGDWVALLIVVWRCWGAARDTAAKAETTANTVVFIFRTKLLDGGVFDAFLSLYSLLFKARISDRRGEDG
jgi:hypothetical protein